MLRPVFCPFIIRLMRAVEAMRLEAELIYGQLRETVLEISEPLAWAKIPVAEGEYLHSNGTIIGIVQHVATCKYIYGSAAFRSLDVRFRDCFARMEEIGTSWDGTVKFLGDSQAYWMAAWADLADEELDAGRASFRGDLRPTWKLIGTVTQHDAHHLGQIQMLGAVLTPAVSPPDMELEEEKKHCLDLPSW